MSLRLQARGPAEPDMPWLRDIERMDRGRLIAQLADPMWRIRNLYTIMTKDGQIVPFRPNAAQEDFLGRLHPRIIVLKARQLGFTTLLQLLGLDLVLWTPNVRAGVIAHERDAMETLFRDKILFAYDHLPASVRAMVPLGARNVTELTFRNNSAISVSLSFRSGTLQFLHVSEFGKLCARYPGRAAEVVTGAFPTVDASGMIVIESTAEGESGPFYDMSMRAIGLLEQGRAPSPLEYAIHFHPWMEAPEYEANPAGVRISLDDHTYFSRIEVAARTQISMRKRAWYVQKKVEQGELMKREYPSTPSEAFESSTEGKFYTAQMAWLSQEGRLTDIPIRPDLPVNTFWDIGASDGTAIWFHQRVGLKDCFIDYEEGWDKPYSWFVALMNARGYIWGVHHLPHDATHRKQQMNANLSPEEMLRQLGLRRIKIVPRVNDLNHGIAAMRQAFATCWFDQVRCAAGLTHLRQYGKTWSTTAQHCTDEPLKDGHTEAADALRQFAQGFDPSDRVVDPGEHRGGISGRSDPEGDYRVAPGSHRTGSWRTA